MNKPILSPDTANPLQRIRVVLSHTFHPGNIGSTARAMKVMGLSQLYLVNPHEFPSDTANALASGAVDVLQQAVVTRSLAEALTGTVAQVALTSRRRELTVPLQTPRQIAPELLALARNGDVALVFGHETSGLSIDEVEQCNRLVTIAANPAYPSLNLAQAVQVLCYELRTSMENDVSWLQEPPRELASHDAIEGFYQHLEQTLYQLGFLKPARSNRVLPRLRRLFGRTGLEREELAILRGMVASAEKQLRRTGQVR
jgi:tRNA/rRNA methyltransferase